MDLSDENKATIDAKSHYELLCHWRNAPPGDPWFAGDTGGYWRKRMAEMRNKDPAGAVADSKAVGWGQHDV